MVSASIMSESDVEGIMTSKTVRTKINYTLDNGRAPNFYFYKPDPSEKKNFNPAGTDVREVEVENGWDLVETFDPDKQGFALKNFEGKFSAFDNEAQLKTIFYEQVISFVKKNTGAKRVEIFDHTIRRRMSEDIEEQTEVRRPAVRLAHCDYTHESGPKRVRDLLPDDAEVLLQKRVAFYNVWKPLVSKVEELPLAVCDASSNQPGDLLMMNLKYRDRDGEIYVLRYSPKHKWIYFPEMRSSHALLLKTYDSETDGRARFMAHSAFEDPDTPENAIPRESIEVRTMAFF